MPRSLSREAERAFRERLCRVAARQFSTLGYAGVTLRARAARLRRLADLNEAVAGKHRDPVARIEALGRAYVRFAKQEPDRYRLTFEAAPAAKQGRSPELSRQLRRSVRPLRQAVREAVERGLLRGDSETITQVCWSALHGAIVLHLTGRRDGSVRDLEATTAVTIDALLHGLIAGEAA